METSYVILVRELFKLSHTSYQQLRVARSISLANGQVHVAQISNNEILLFQRTDAVGILLQYYHCTVDFAANTLRFNVPSDPSKVVATCIKSGTVLSSVLRTLNNRFRLDTNDAQLIFGHKVGNVVMSPFISPIILTNPSSSPFFIKTNQANSELRAFTSSLFPTYSTPQSSIYGIRRRTRHRSSMKSPARVLGSMGK